MITTAKRLAAFDESAANRPQRPMPSALTLVTGRERDFAPTTDFVDAMSALASGVVLVTSWEGGRPWGMTVTAFASVSADPPTVLVSLGSGTASAGRIAATRSFGVSILAEDQRAVARLGSKPGATKFLEPFVDRDDLHGRSPVVAGALAHLDCELSDVLHVADHAVLFGRVHAAFASDSGRPLLYHRRGYRTLDDCVTGRSIERTTTCPSS